MFICKTIVNKCGGEICVLNKTKNRGTTIAFTMEMKVPLSDSHQDKNSDKGEEEEKSDTNSILDMLNNSQIDAESQRAAVSLGHNRS